MANTYAFTTLNFAGVDTNFQVITGINNAGTLVGYYGDGQPVGLDPSKSFVWLPTSGVGKFTAFSSTYAQTRINGINNASVPGAVGVSVDGAGSVTGAVTVAPTAGATVAAANISASGGTNPHLTGLNDAGARVGWFVVSGGGTSEVDRAATVSGSALVALTLTPASGAGTITSSRAYGVDNSNDVVGTAVVSLAGGGSVTEGFVQTAGSPTVTLYTAAGDVAGATATRILATNNQGQVAGDYVDGGGRTHGFVKDLLTGEFTTIDAPAGTGAVATHVDGINDQGHLVGYYDVAVTVGGVATVQSSGFLNTRTDTRQAVVNPTAGSTIAVVLGSTGVAVGGSTAVTLLDPGFGHAILTGNAGNDTYNIFGTADTVVADRGSGNNTINAAGGSFAQIFLGAGRNAVQAGVSSTVVASSGADTIAANGAVVFAGASSLASATVGVGVPPSGVAVTANTVVGGAGFTVVNGIASVGGTLFFGGTGTNVFNGAGGSGTVSTGGAATVVGTTGTDYFTAGAGGGLLFGGGGTSHLTGNSITVGKNGTLPGALAATTIVTGSGQTTVTAYAGAVFLTGDTDQVVLSGIAASVGNLSLVGTNSSGDDTYVLGTAGAAEQVFLGAGHDTVFLGNGGKAQIVTGAGPDTFYLGSNVVSGADTIFGFRPGADRVLLQNFSATSVATAINRQQAAPGSSTVVTLGSGAKITFYGVSHVDAGVFGPG